MHFPFYITCYIMQNDKLTILLAVDDLHTSTGMCTTTLSSAELEDLLSMMANEMDESQKNLCCWNIV